MPSSPSPERSAATQLERKLEELHTKKHLPGELVAIVAEVSRLQQDALPAVRFADMREQTLPADVRAAIRPVEARAQGGVILPREEFPLDMAVARGLRAPVMDVLRRNAPQLLPLQEALTAALDAEPDMFERACRSVLLPHSPAAKEGAGPDDPLAEWAARHPEAPGFFRFVAQSAVMPSLSVAGSLLGVEYDNDALWQHGHCPVCGSAPLMGRLSGTEGARSHVCSFCSFEFRVPRIGCPFCLAAEYGGSEYYASEDEPGYLLDVCASCNCYIKLADFRALDSAWLPLLDDLASLSLDIYARQMGYARLTLSAWGF